MRPAEDRRPGVRSFVWPHPDLTWREKAYLIRVTELGGQSARRGSKAMGWDGQFALHLDYIARMLGAHPDTVSDAQKGCLRKGFLSLVHPPAYGRPATYQAHRCQADVDAAREANRQPITKGKSRVVTNRQNTPAYTAAEVAVTTGETPLLTYKGGTQPDHAGSRPSAQPGRYEQAAAKRTSAESGAEVRFAVDGIEDPDDRSDRRTA